MHLNDEKEYFVCVTICEILKVACFFALYYILQKESLFSGKVRDAVSAKKYEKRLGF